MSNHIDNNQLEFPELSIADSVGNVFFWDNRVFRAIRHEAVEKITALFSSGLIDELVANNLFPKSWFTNHTIDGFGLVIEHTKFSIITYPYEWTFSMLKDSAITILKTNIIANRYGYQIKDGHGYNIIFNGLDPTFIDLGSFVKTIPNEFNNWQGHKEFLKCYCYPLRMWSLGNEYVARHILSSQSEIPHHEYFLYKYCFFRLLSPVFLEKITEFYFKIRQISLIPSERIKNKVPGFLGDIICYLKNKHVLPLQSVDLQSLIIKIQAIKKKKHKTTWSGYHDEHYTKDGKMKSTPRFDRIINIIRTYEIKSIVDLAGNQGIFSRLLIERTGIDDVICSDSDEGAVDLMYCSCKSANIKIFPVLLNFMSPTLVSGCEPPSKRFKRDGVTALAVTHHLLLTQGIQIDCILRRIASYTNKYAFIEFMPLGLYDGNIIPSIPSWYTLDWFRDSFRKYFSIIIEEKLEKNRILFFGKLI